MIGSRGPAQEGVIAAAVVLGTIGAVTTGIGAAVYAVEGRAFTTPWVVGSLFSSAICGGMAIALFSEADSGAVAVAFALIYVGLAAWPAAWSIRSALNPAGFGQPLDAPAPLPRPERALADPLPRPALALSFEF